MRIFKTLFSFVTHHKDLNFLVIVTLLTCFMNFGIIKLSLAKVKNMKHVNIHETKTHLSRLLEEVAQGEEVIICKAGHPIARLVAYQNLPKERKPGFWKGKVKIAEDFDVLPSSMLAAFKGENE